MEGTIKIYKTCDGPQHHGSSRRKEHLEDIQAYIQSLWNAERVFEANPPDEFLSEQREKDDGEKFFCTFPYPYMNGRLHLGHAFTLLKAEFQARYQRLNGKNVLWPFAFHCTGMPISACADKLKLELQGAAVELRPNDSTTKTDMTSVVPQMPKAYAPKSQREILLSCNVEESLIHHFTDANFWMSYFPVRGQEDLKTLGLAVDWRRSFVTTQTNPYYDAFIKWQFNLLKKRNRVRYGNRATVFCVEDNQASADHDRLVGEGVCPQEYTLIKMKVMSSLDSIGLKTLSSHHEVYLVAATLRPETMYGQTNCFVLPSGTYGLFLALDEPVTNVEGLGAFNVVMSPEEAMQTCHNVFICSKRSALNMGYQGVLPVKRHETTGIYEPICLGEVQGDVLLGLQVCSPLSVIKELYVLPMMTLSMEKGTGVVTSVPSDSADDYAALRDLQCKSAFREKYHLKDYMVPKDIVSVMHIPGYGEHAAVELYNKRKVKSQHDKTLLGEIKEELYKKGFYEGVMAIGPYKGKKVCDIKDNIRRDLINNHDAVVYFEPEKLVLSRRRHPCIVALCNQWYLDYSNEDWKAAVDEFIANSRLFNAFSTQCLNQLRHAVSWIKDWACSRIYGLGTFLPWEIDQGNKVLIESLSDSTIYMAYYTIAHYLQGNLDGSQRGLLKIAVEDLNDDVFDYIFMQTDVIPTSTCIPSNHLKLMRREFEYWYPMDLRVTGKDLIFNHLIMSLFNHAAVWPQRREATWPRAFFCNGHVLVDCEKMSKSAGNFLTLQDIVSMYSSDGARVTLADAGDSLDDANFQRDIANASVMKLYLLEQSAKETVQLVEKQFRTGTLNWVDVTFKNEMVYLFEKTRECYDSLVYHGALKYGFYDFTIIRDRYRNFCGEARMHKDCIFEWLELQVVLLFPVAPHICEYIWKEHMKKSGLLSTTPYLKTISFPPVDVLLRRQYEFFVNCCEDFRSVKDKAFPAKKCVTVDTSLGAVVYVAKSYLPWQQTVLSILQKVPLAPCNRKPLNNDYIDMVRRHPDILKLDKKTAKLVLPFASYRMKTEVAAQGPQALEFKPPFDEYTLLLENSDLLGRLLFIGHIEVRCSTEETHPLDSTDRKLLAMPFNPSIVFFTL